MSQKIYRAAIAFLFLFISSKICFAQNWQLVWQDEFTNNISSDWVFETGGGGWGNNELQYYRQENASIENGNLKISVKKEDFGGRNYTSARMKTESKKFFKYGKIEARIAVPAVQGIWPAFWMLGQNIGSVGWPKCGEIDIMEHVNLGNTNFGTIHWENENGVKVEYGGKTEVNTITNYHTYTVEWDAKLIKWFVDGVKYHEASIENGVNGTSEFHENFFILLNVAVGGNWPGNNIDNNAMPVNMYVDYVRVYQDGVNVIQPSEDVVTTYFDCNYGGFSGGLSVGNYTQAQLTAIGVNDNTVSSIKVAEGYKVTLYANDNFTGNTKVLTANSSCLSDFNDVVSSIKVQTNGQTGLDNTYFIQNRNSGLFMDIAGGEVATGDGINVFQWTSTGTKNQQYKFTHLGNGTYQILAMHSNKSLDVDAISKNNGANVQQWTYYGTPNQQFIVYPSTNGYYKLIPKHSGKVIEVVNASTASSANIQQFDNNNQTCGQWKFIPTSQVTAIEDNWLNNSIQISPNPVVDYINLSNTNFEQAYISNLLGEKLKTIQSTSTNVADLSAGIYILTIINNKAISSQKFIKQ